MIIILLTKPPQRSPIPKRNSEKLPMPGNLVMTSAYTVRIDPGGRGEKA